MKVEKLESKSHRVPPPDKPHDTKTVAQAGSKDDKKSDKSKHVGQSWGPAVINNISTTNIYNTTTYNSNVSNTVNNVNTTNNYASPSTSPTRPTSYQMRRLADYQAAIQILSAKNLWV